MRHQKFTEDDSKSTNNIYDYFSLNSGMCVLAQLQSGTCILNIILYVHVLAQAGM